MVACGVETFPPPGRVIRSARLAPPCSVNVHVVVVFRVNVKIADSFYGICCATLVSALAHITASPDSGLALIDQEAVRASSIRIPVDLNS